MNWTLRVGIVIPNYERLDYLMVCVQSVFRQTYRNIELFISDDHSPDKNIKRYLQSLPNSRVRWKINSRSLGTTKNYDSGVRSLSDSVDWVLILDNDDFLDSKCIEEAVNTVCEYPKSKILHLHQIWIDAEGRRIGDDSRYPKTETAEDFLLARAQGSQDIRSSAMFFNMKHYQKVGGYPQFSSGMTTDPALTFALSFDNELVYAKNATVYIRLHEGAESSTADNLIEKINSICQLSTYCAAVYEQNPPVNSQKHQQVMNQLKKYEQRLIDALLSRFSSQVHEWRLYADVLEFCHKKSITVPLSFIVSAYSYRLLKRDPDQFPILTPFLQRMKKIHVSPIMY